MLRSRVVRVVAIVLGMVLSFWAGGRFAVGSLMSRFITPGVHAEEARNLDIALNLAAMIQLGEEEKAIRVLDMLIDSWSVGLSRSAPWDEIEPDRQQMLLLAKQYRAAFPARTHPDHSPEELYADIPDVASVPGDNLRPVRRLLAEVAAIEATEAPAQSDGGS